MEVVVLRKLVSVEDAISRLLELWFGEFCMMW